MFLPEAMVISEPGLLPGTISVSMGLSELESVMSMARGATKSHMDAWGLGQSCGHAGIRVPYCHWGHGVIWTRAAAEGHICVPDPTITKVYVDVCGP